MSPVAEARRRRRPRPAPPPHRRVCSPVETEINVQLGQLTWKRHHMQLLDRAICSHPDFVAVFGEAAAAERHQCAEVRRTEQTRWLRLLGARHDLHIWAADERSPPPPSTALRLPAAIGGGTGGGGAGGGAPEWMRHALAEFAAAVPSLTQMESPSLVCASAAVAMLTGEGPGGVRKEVLLVRNPPRLEIYGVVSHGRCAPPPLLARAPARTPPIP